MTEINSFNATRRYETKKKNNRARVKLELRNIFLLLHGAGFCFLLLLLLLLEPSSASLRFRFCRSCRFQDEKRKPKIDILRLASTQLLALSSDLSRLFCLNGHVTENFSSRDSHSANRRGSSELKSVLLFLRMHTKPLTLSGQRQSGVGERSRQSRMSTKKNQDERERECVCVCMCVCERVRERGRESECMGKTEFQLPGKKTERRERKRKEEVTVACLDMHIDVTATEGLLGPLRRRRLEGVGGQRNGKKSRRHKWVQDVVSGWKTHERSKSWKKTKHEAILIFFHSSGELSLRSFLKNASNGMLIRIKLLPWFSQATLCFTGTGLDLILPLNYQPM